jgi:hypothetical protein
MTNALTTARTGLASLLADAGFTVSSEVPQTFSPPLCWIAPRTPYRQPGQTIGSKKISLAVICLAAQGTNEDALEAVDDMTSSVADTVEASGVVYVLDPSEEIGVPQLYSSAQGQQYLGAAVNVLVRLARP